VTRPGGNYGCPLTALRALALIGLGASLAVVGFVAVLRHMPPQRYGR
jgi:hypothetical protein